MLRRLIPLATLKNGRDPRDLACVYITSNPSSGKFYVGKSHLSYIQRGYFGSGVWPKSAKKAGAELNTVVLARFSNEADALAVERVLATTARMDSLCMNLTEGGDGLTSAVAQQVAAMPHVRAAKWASFQERMKDPSYAQRLRDGIKAAAQTDAAKARLCAQLHSPEAKKKQLEALKRRMADPEHKAQIVGRLTEIARSQEFREWQANRMRQLTANPEWKEKQKRRHEARWAEQDRIDPEGAAERARQREMVARHKATYRAKKDTEAVSAA